ncbi:STAS domain-containing protein [Fulvimonas sp. R45]|uniref:STAS domain-containing protein n=1 Tax=Fulvimonas sp. R45 TaxID=3045937 RepID=UPI00265F62B8|nr:STAS domain-containing protein [Fulvimonas sp. R45]MDO1530415.1 STAS domain-containing protein [Fulvimonas sp. R45]
MAGRKDDEARVALPADCRMAAAPALHAALCSALARPACVLDGAAVERVDTSALQLLAAFRRDAVARGVAVRWHGASAALREAAGLLGLARALDLPATQPA